MEIYNILILSFAGMATLATAVYIIRLIRRTILRWLAQWVLLHLVYPRLFNSRNAALFNPSRAEIVYHILHISLAIFCTSYGVDSIASVGSRAGQVAIAYMVPLMAVKTTHWLATILGVRLETFQLWHSSMGFMAAAETIVHSIISLRGRNLRELDSIYGLVCFILVLLLVLLPLGRRLAYEVFLNGHAALTIALGIFLYQHLELKSHLGRLTILVATALLFASSFLQYFFQIFTNIGFTKQEGIRLPRIVHLKDGKALGDVTMLCLDLARPMFFLPGQYILLSFLTLRHCSFWQRHPLTVIWWRNLENGRQELWLFVRQEKGWTADLTTTGQVEYQRPDDTDQPARCAAWIQGPYGQAPDLTMTGYVLLIATNDGIFAQLPLLKALTDGARLKDVKTRHIAVVWQISTEYFDLVKKWIDPLLLDEDLEIELLHFSLHLKKDASTEVEEVGRRLTIHYDVPNIKEYIDKALSSNNRRTAVVVSAHHRMREDVRQEVVQHHRMREDVRQEVVQHQEDELQYFETEYQPRINHNRSGDAVV